MKQFGLPNMRFIGENSRIELRVNLYNAFNKLNLAPFTFGSSSTILSYGNLAPVPPATTGLPNPNPLFGIASSALSGRTIEISGKFIFLVLRTTAANRAAVLFNRRPFFRGIHIGRNASGGFLEKAFVGAEYSAAFGNCCIRAHFSGRAGICFGNNHRRKCRRAATIPRVRRDRN